MSENEDTLAKGIEVRCRRDLGNTQVAKRDYEHAGVPQLGSIASRRRQARTIEETNLDEGNESVIEHERDYWRHVGALTRAVPTSEVYCVTIRFMQIR